LPLALLHGFLSFLLLAGLSHKALAQELVTKLEVSPLANQLRPFSEPAEITVYLTNADGSPIENAWVQIYVDAPKSRRFFSTDFPIVEGTRLLDMRLPIRDGKAQWQYLFPIRGQYRISVEALTSNNQKSTAALEITVKEKEWKWFLLGVFTLGLFLSGFVAGRIFTHSSTVSNRKVLLCFMVSMLHIGIYTVKAFTQDVKSDVGPARLEIDAAPVGKLSQVRWYRVGPPLGDDPVDLSLKFTHLETGKTVFAIEKLIVAKEFSMRFQFTDGDEYRIEAMAYPKSGQPIRSERTVSITGIEPPAIAAIPALAFFVFVIACGLWAGRRSRSRQH